MDNILIHVRIISFQKYSHNVHMHLSSKSRELTDVYYMGYFVLRDFVLLRCDCI